MAYETRHHQPANQHHGRKGGCGVMKKRFAYARSEKRNLAYRRLINMAKSGGMKSVKRKISGGEHSKNQHRNSNIRRNINEIAAKGEMAKKKKKHRNNKAARSVYYNNENGVILSASELWRQREGATAKAEENGEGAISVA